MCVVNFFLVSSGFMGADNTNDVFHGIGWKIEHNLRTLQSKWRKIYYVYWNVIKKWVNDG